MLLYEDLAQFYFDIEKPSRNIQKEFDFLTSQFKKYRVKKVLDAGCGSGEHVAHLSQMGYEVTGCDISQAMLSVAKSRFPFSNYYCSPMEEFSADKDFDAIVSIFGSFNYLTTNDAIQRALRNFHHILADDGILILEVWHALPILTIKRKPLSNVARVISGEKVIQRNRGFRTMRKDEEVVVEVNYLYDVDGREFNDRHLMRVFGLKELQELCEKGGFRMLHVYGNLDKGRITDNSSRILYIGQKTRRHPGEDLLDDI